MYNGLLNKQKTKNADITIYDMLLPSKETFGKTNFISSNHLGKISYAVLFLHIHLFLRNMGKIKNKNTILFKTFLKRNATRKKKLICT